MFCGIRKLVTAFVPLSVGATIDSVVLSAPRGRSIQNPLWNESLFDKAYWTSYIQKCVELKVVGLALAGSVKMVFDLREAIAV